MCVYVCMCVCVYVCLCVWVGVSVYVFKQTFCCELKSSNVCLLHVHQGWESQCTSQNDTRYVAHDTDSILIKMYV